MSPGKKRITVDHVREHVQRHHHTPFMVSEVAEKLESNFDTTKDHLLHLAAIGFLDVKKIGRHWLFWKKIQEE